MCVDVEQRTGNSGPEPRTQNPEQRAQRRNVTKRNENNNGQRNGSLLICGALHGLDVCGGVCPAS